MSFPQEQLLKENIMKLSSTAIKELSAQYRSVLKKCFILNACVSPFCLLNSNCGSFWPPLILPANYPEINLFQARMPAVLGSERFFQLPAACHSNGPQLQLRTMSLNLPLGRFAQSPHFQQQLPGPHHTPTC